MALICASNARGSMDRIYLYVSPEEYPEVKASGASWDDASKSWSIGDGMEPPAAVVPAARTKPRREHQAKSGAFRAQTSPRGPAAESPTPQGVAARVKDAAAASVQPPRGAAE
jgi:hypothetical protein